MSLNTSTVLSPTRPLTIGKFSSLADPSPPQVPQSITAGTLFPLTNCSNPSWTSVLSLYLVPTFPTSSPDADPWVSITRMAANPALLDDVIHPQLRTVLPHVSQISTMITTSTLSRFIPTILGSATRLSTSVTYEFFLLENGRLVLPMSSTLPCSVPQLSLRTSYVCGASASFIHRSKYVLRQAINMLGFSPSSGEQVRNRCL